MTPADELAQVQLTRFAGQTAISSQESGWSEPFGVVEQPLGGHERTGLSGSARQKLIPAQGLVVLAGVLVLCAT